MLNLPWDDCYIRKLKKEQEKKNIDANVGRT